MDDKRFRRLERLLVMAVMTIIFAIIGAGEYAAGDKDFGVIFFLAALLYGLMAVIRFGG